MLNFELHHMLHHVQYHKASRRRALGQETDSLCAPRPKLRTNRGAEFLAEIISEYLKQDRTDDSIKLGFIYIGMSVEYLEQRSQSVLTACFVCAEKAMHTLEGTGETGEGIFKSRKDVWKHTKAHRSEHLWPFSCPECDRLGYGSDRRLWGVVQLRI